MIEEQRAVLSGKGGEIDGDKTILGRDILSVLSKSLRARRFMPPFIVFPVRSNIATAANANMSVDEVLCQISTFIAAGHETTSSALTWCMYALVQNPLVQRKLRAALRDVERDLQLEHAGLEESNPQLYQQTLTDRLSKCEYLDWVIREALRLHAPITSTMRVCMRDEDEIPVSSEGANGEHNGGGCVDKNGKRLFGIRVKKWDIITIPIQAINKSQALWGEDARAFKYELLLDFGTLLSSNALANRPERWAQPPSTAKAIPGLYSNTLTFLNGNPLDGNRACIGYKFALIEYARAIHRFCSGLAQIVSQDENLLIHVGQGHRIPAGGLDGHREEGQVSCSPSCSSAVCAPLELSLTLHLSQCRHPAIRQVGARVGESDAAAHPASLSLRRVLAPPAVSIITHLAHRIELTTLTLL